MKNTYVKPNMKTINIKADPVLLSVSAVPQILPDDFGDERYKGFSNVQNRIPFHTEALTSGL